jgi:alpha-L-rhamnosidase
MAGLEMHVPAATAAQWQQQQQAAAGATVANCSVARKPCPAHPGRTYCPSDPDKHQCSSPGPHHAGGGGRQQITVKMSEQLCPPPGLLPWIKCPHNHTILYPESSGNKYISTLTLANGTASNFEHHEYVGLWRYADIQLGGGAGKEADGARRYNTPVPLAQGELPFNFSRWTVAYPFNKSQSAFTSSSLLLNRIWGLCRDTLQHTSLDTFTDSNTRERLPYEADGFITVRSRYALQAELAWPAHSIAHVLSNPTWPTEWKQYMIMIIHEHWMQSGETTLASENFDLLVNNTMLPFINPATQLVDWTGHQVKPDPKKPSQKSCYTKYCDKKVNGGSCAHDPAGTCQACALCHVSTGYGSDGGSDGGCSCDNPDWQPSYRAGFVFSNQNVVINAFAVKSMEQLAALATAIGGEHAQHAAMLREQAAKTKAAMLKLMYSENSGLWCDGLCSVTKNNTSFHAQHFPLWLGITPDAGVKKALAAIKPQGMLGSVYTAHSLIHGLFERATSVDNGQTALELMTQCTSHSWCNMLRNGATTSWEMWGKHEGTHSHPWSTTPASAIAAGLMGVRPTAPGWTKWLAKPAPGNLSTATIVIPTKHGLIHSALVNSDPARIRMQLTLTVPSGTEATVCLLKIRGADRLRLNGVLVAASEHIEPAYLCIEGLTARSGGAGHVIVRS